jgi:lipid II:glycine glycyltransferase (peptidoglycan interpeptide bridge formation enzyme)
MEPNGTMGLGGTYRSHGFVQGPLHFQPSRTVKVPLGDDDALLAQMHQKTRYNVRLAQRRGVEIRRACGSDQDLACFYDLLRDTAERNEFGVHNRTYYDDFMAIFGDRAVLLFARIDERPVAGLIAARFGEEAVYMYGASSTEHRAHGAAFLLQFEAMRWARDSGCTRYDLWGIPAHDPPPAKGEEGRVGGTSGEDWRGLYIFKVRFGGEFISYPPTLERRLWGPISWAARRLALSRA